tara:strand:- start:255 stop:950 length:696 start_codon:yes stop_codon:yes gene_type:complete
MYIKTELPKHPLGDRFDYFLYSHCVSLEGVNVVMDEIKDFDIFKRVMRSNVTIGKEEKVHYYGTKAFKKWYRTLFEFPKANNITTYDVKLPEKFVVSAWDAGQEYRVIELERRKRIEKFWKNKGYEIVIVGGEAKEDKFKNDLDFIFYVISKAEAYVGADSGFMHLSKAVLPLNSIFPYVNMKWEHDEIKDLHRKSWQNYEDGRSLTAQVKILEETGVQLNRGEKPGWNIK